MTGLVVLVAVLGIGVGLLADRAARRFPWTAGEADRGGAVPAPVTVACTAVLFALVAVRFGFVWELPAFVLLAGVAVLLVLIDLRHHLLPDRVVLPAIAAGAVLLASAAAIEGDGRAILRAGIAAVVLFVVFLLLALLAPSGLGMGDVKLAALLGLYLGWLGWGVVALGAAAGFVVQAVLALLLLATRRIGLKGELPFGPAMLLGAAVAIGWGTALLG